MTLSKRRWSILLAASVVALGASAGLAYQWFIKAPPLKPATEDFLVRPYVQLGREGDPNRPSLVFASEDAQKRDWSVQLRTAGAKPEDYRSDKLNVRAVALSNVPKFAIFSLSIPLSSSAPTNYVVFHRGRPIFESKLAPAKSENDPLRVDVAGDVASGLPSETAVAAQIFASKPDMVVIPGDIVYKFGRVLEYLDHYFPIYNDDDSKAGHFPLLRNTLTVAAPGNHDTAVGARNDTRNLSLFPDGLGYFMLWQQPLNGPEVGVDGQDEPVPEGPKAAVDAFRSAAGSYYPREENFSFNYGNSHWTILDGNNYVDWTHPALRQWLSKDLENAKSSTWKFVVFHQTCFSSDSHHFTDQQMRQVVDIFEKNGVDVVFAGHVHNYQRTYPLLFKAHPGPDGKLRQRDGTVAGDFALDKEYDGSKKTTPKGIIYITTGGGGAPLSGGDISFHPERWQPFTKKFLPVYSFTRCDIEGSHLHIEQIDTHGKPIDEFNLDKGS